MKFILVILLIFLPVSASLLVYKKFFHHKSSGIYVLNEKRSATAFLGLIKLINGINELQNGKYTDHELASARIGFEEVENYLLTSGSKSNIFVKGFAEIANIYKRSCEISATIGIATRGMNNREWVEYKKDNLKLFNTQQELNAKAVRALRDLELRTTEFINWNMGSLKQKDRERLAGVLKLYLSDEIAESQKKIQKSKDRSTVKLPVLAWSYLALDEYLNKNEWELVGDILERMKELNETMRDDK